MTTENEQTPTPEPQPAPARTSEQVKTDLLANMKAMEDSTRWWDRDEILASRQVLYAELEQLTKSQTKPANELKPTVKEGADDDEQQKPEGQEQTTGEYEIRVPDTLSASNREEAIDFAADAVEIGKEAGIPQDTMQTLFDFITDVQLTRGVEGLNLSNATECVNVMNTQYGLEAEGLIRDAKAGAKMLGPKGLMYLDATGLGNAPPVLVALAHFYRGEFKLSPEAAQKELTKVRASKAYQAGERSAVDRGRLLGMLATRAGGELLPPKASGGAGAAKTKDTNAELTKLRMDPAYFDKSMPNHKTVVARVHELTKALYGEE
jgi:hypothetical protein